MTTILLCIVLYLGASYVTAMALWANAKFKDKESALVSGLIWPLSIVLVLVAALTALAAIPLMALPLKKLAENIL